MQHSKLRRVVSSVAAAHKTYAGCQLSITRWYSTLWRATHPLEVPVEAVQVLDVVAVYVVGGVSEQPVHDVSVRVQHVYYGKRSLQQIK